MHEFKIKRMKDPPTGTEVFVEKEKYLEIIGFTSYTYFTNKITKYSGIAGGRIRTLGEYIESFIYGKIAEEAFKTFLENKLGLQTLTEIEIVDFLEGVYLPDIIAVKIKDDWKPAKFWVDVKEVRRDQKWLLVSASSARQRPYDAYVAVWVGLPEDHVIFLAESVPEVKEKMGESWRKKASEVAGKINRIPCRILGFATWNDISSVMTAHSDTASTAEKKRALEYLNKKYGEKGSSYFDGSKALFDPDDSSWSGAVVGENIGFATTRLEKSSDWSEFHSLLLKNERIIPPIPLPRTKSGNLSKRSGVPPGYSKYADYREAFQAYLADQLSHIEKRFGGIKRTTSWFAQSF